MKEELKDLLYAFMPYIIAFLVMLFFIGIMIFGSSI